MDSLKQFIKTKRLHKYCSEPEFVTEANGKRFVRITCDVRLAEVFAKALAGISHIKQEGT